MLVRMHGGLAATATVFVVSCELVAPVDALSNGPDGSVRPSDSSDAAYDAPAPPSADVAAAGDSPGEGGGDGSVVIHTPDSGPPDGGPDASLEASVDAPVDAPADAAVGVDAAVDVGPPPCTLTSCGARAVCVAGACVPAQRVFLSSTTYTGNLGGHAGADATCQQLAAAAGLGGTWMAWISDSASCPSARFLHASNAYRLLDGTVVAASFSALVSGSLGHGIDLDQGGHPPTGTTEVWTATNPDGTLAGDGCSSFTSGNHAASTPAVGVADNTDATWTDVYLQFCDRSDHLYCFEQ
jgi:hypothetical protein